MRCTSWQTGLAEHLYKPTTNNMQNWLHPKRNEAENALPLISEMHSSRREIAKALKYTKNCTRNANLNVLAGRPGSPGVPPGVSGVAGGTRGWSPRVVDDEQTETEERERCGPPLPKLPLARRRRRCRRTRRSRTSSGVTGSSTSNTSSSKESSSSSMRRHSGARRGDATPPLLPIGRSSFWVSHSLGITRSGAGAGRGRRFRGRQRPTLPSQPFYESCRTALTPDWALVAGYCRERGRRPCPPQPPGLLDDDGGGDGARRTRPQFVSAAALPADDLPWPHLAPTERRYLAPIRAALGKRRSLELFRPFRHFSIEGAFWCVKFWHRLEPLIL